MLPHDRAHDVARRAPAVPCRRGSLWRDRDWRWRPLRDPRSRPPVMDHYAFNGSAAPGWVGQAAGRGLDVGVLLHAGWAGWFAVTLAAAGPEVVWHRPCPPPAPVGSGVGEAVGGAVRLDPAQRDDQLRRGLGAVVTGQEHVAGRLGPRLRRRRGHGSLCRSPSRTTRRPPKRSPSRPTGTASRCGSGTGWRTRATTCT